MSAAMTVNLLTVVSYLLYGIAAIFAALVAMICTKTDRTRFPWLQKLDGKKFRMTIWLIVCIVVGVVVNIKKDFMVGDAQAEQRKQFKTLEAKSRTDGVLIAPTNSNIQSLKLVFEDGRALEFAGVKLAEGIPLKPFSLIGHDLPVTVTRSNGNLYVSADFRSLDGTIVARLVNNEWSVPNNYFFRNYDQSAVEVTDREGVPYLQVELLDNSSIRLGGVIISDTHYFISGRKGVVSGTISPDTNIRAIIKQHCIRSWFASELGKRATTVEPCSETKYQVLASRHLQPNVNETNGLTNWSEQWIIEVNTPTGVGTLRDAVYYSGTNTPDSTVIADSLERAKRMLGWVGVTNTEPTCLLKR